MAKKQPKTLDLGKEKISKLLFAFAVPTVISMLVNSIYNIVDQIFIGQGVGTLGNAATNVIFPLVILFSGIASLIGNGASANLALKLGEGKKEEASKVVGAATVFTIIAAVVVGILAYIFLPQLVYLFGCTENVYQYAVDYGRIIILGAPFMMIYSALAGIIRSDGSPKFSMALLVVGTIINLILDPIMIFGFNMGVQGGALATIIGQVVSGIMALSYFRHSKNFKINRKALRPNKTITRSVALGLSSFITQVTVLILFIYMNNILTKLGANSDYGADVPLSAYGVVSKISNLFISTVLGIAIGAQPIIGFNYGARNFKRVKEAIRYIIFLNLIVGVVFNAIFLIFPRQLASMFISPSDPTYDLFMQFAEKLCRIFMMVLALNAFEITTSVTMQSLGNVKKATACAFLRQIILFIPISLLLSLAFGYGIDGVLMAGPIADAITFIIAAILMVRELRKLEQRAKTPVNIEETVEMPTESASKNNLVITIAREYGSGGKYVGKLLAEKLNVKLYDKEIISLAAKDSGLSADYIKEMEQRRKAGSYENNNDDRIFVAESKVIEDIAKGESCVIVGRCANYILGKRKNVLNVFLYSDEKSKIKRAVEYYGVKKKGAKNTIEKINRDRASHYKYYTGENWRNLDNYDLALNVDKLGVEETANLISGVADSIADARANM